ncbi:lactadherin-like [Notothenia coriiceps]|uniref:Lactadherin-like n=1 Tax=Notothenia coriiceps TaxID=8208 RepID=A0A6I9PJW9_9TELE|nr:PREDICTED: lactadherin-like [Notothenia coriiceps]
MVFGTALVHVSSGKSKAGPPVSLLCILLLYCIILSVFCFTSLAGLGCFLSVPCLSYSLFSFHSSLCLSVSSLPGLTSTVYSNSLGCSEPMGMKSRLLTNRQITSSSTFRTWGMEAFTWYPHYARLDKQGKTNAWTAATNNQSEWLQVDLGATKKVTGVITQGAKDFGSIQFVTAFKVAYSNDGRSWTIVKDETTKTHRIFPGNSDNNVHKKNIFEPSFYARYVRILPWDWHERITLRMELLGCDE